MRSTLLVYDGLLRSRLALCSILTFGCADDPVADPMQAIALIERGDLQAAEQIVEASQLERLPRAQFLRALIAHLKDDRGAHRMIEALPDDPAARVLAQLEAGLDRESAWRAAGEPDLSASALFPMPIDRWPLPTEEQIAAHAKDDVGFFEATFDSRIQLHMERQQRALWMLRWLPWSLFSAAVIAALWMGWRWQTWTSRRLRWCIGLLLGLAIALPFASMFAALYPLFFAIDRPDAEQIAQAVSSSMNRFAFGILGDGAVVVLFLISRKLRR